MTPMRIPTMAHGIEQALRKLGPYRAKIRQKGLDGLSGDAVYLATIVGLKTLPDGTTFVTLKDTTLPGIRLMDVHVESLKSIDYEGDPNWAQPTR